MNRSDRRGVLHRYGILLAALAVTAAGAGCGRSGDGQTAGTAGSDRQAQVAACGSSVMPFDLERTAHRFVKTDAGWRAVPDPAGRRGAAGPLMTPSA